MIWSASIQSSLGQSSSGTIVSHSTDPSLNKNLHRIQIQTEIQIEVTHLHSQRVHRRGTKVCPWLRWGVRSSKGSQAAVKIIVIIVML